MTIGLGTRAELAQSRRYRVVRRAGAYADISFAAAIVDLFNVSGLCAIHYMFGVCTTVIGAGLCLPRLQFTPTVGAVRVPLCTAAASIATDAAGTIYTWDGLLAGVLAPGAVLGASDALATWAGSFITVAAGVIDLDVAVDAVSGVIDWYVMYLPIAAGAVITSA